MAVQAIDVSEKSSQISEIKYHTATELMEVTFKRNNTTYRYFNVDAETWDNFKDAESLGKHFGKHIRGVFEYEKKQE